LRQKYAHVLKADKPKERQEETIIMGSGEPGAVKKAETLFKRGPIVPEAYEMKGKEFEIRQDEIGEQLRKLLNDIHVETQLTPAQKKNLKHRVSPIKPTIGIIWTIKNDCTLFISQLSVQLTLERTKLGCTKTAVH